MNTCLDPYITAACSATGALDRSQTTLYKNRLNLGIKLILLRLLVIGCLSPVLIPATAEAFELAAGLGAVEEGDDRIRPAANIHCGLGDHWYSQLHLWGRDFGPVEERSYLLGFYRRLGLHAWERLQAVLGVAGLYETTTITYSNDTDEDRSDGRTNIGAIAGIMFEFPFSGPLYGNITWHSHVFPAGALGGLFLASGRKQTMTINFGYQL